MAEEFDDVVALPSVEFDAVLVAAVDDAISGPEVPTAELDPNRALGADPHDFASLYIRHRSSFAAHARRFLRDPRDVDEVVQEAFLRLFLALPELGTELQALSYCRRTVTNLCIDRYRADKRRPRLVNIESLPANDFPDEEIDDPVVRAEDAAFVREALALLTPLHRDALVKREIEEKSLPVIAEELGVPEESVKHLLHRARRALRRHLAKTHLAPGADLEATSTLSLLARSAAAGGGRLGVIAIFTIAVLVGAKPQLPATVLTSWPLGGLLPAVTHALSPQPPADHVTRPARPRALPAPAPHVPGRVKPVREENLALVPKPTAAVKPVASLAAAAAVTTAPSPATDPSATPHASGTPSGGPASGSPAPASPSPEPGSPSPDPRSSPSSRPSPSPSPSPQKARAEASASPVAAESPGPPTEVAP